MLKRWRDRKAEQAADRAGRYLADGYPAAGFGEEMAPPFSGNEKSGGNLARRGEGGSSGGEKHYHGHRDRLRERFLSAGVEALQDYELLELILFRAIPRRDVKPLAKRLLEEFGTVADVLGASPERLLEVRGVGQAVMTELKIVHGASIKLLQEEVLEKPVITSMSQLQDYLRARLSTEKIEQFRVLFLDNKNRLIADEKLYQGTVNHTPVYPREIMRRALELHASAIILVHNHPSGDPKPSKDDISMTLKIVEAGTTMGIRVHDHLIVGKKTVLSFRATGRL